MNVYERALQIVDALEAAGIRATTDPRNIAGGPVAIVREPTLTHDLAYNVTAEWTVALYVPGPRNGDSMAALLGPGGLVARADVALNGIDTARPGPDPDQPSYELTWTEGV